jgi:hypothetical protein
VCCIKPHHKRLTFLNCQRFIVLNAPFRTRSEILLILPVGLDFIEGENIQKKPYPKLPEEPVIKLIKIYQ